MEADNTWTNTTDTGLYPNTKDNALNYNLKNINATKYDVCLDIQYISVETVEMAIKYQAHSPDAEPIDLATIPLLQTDQNTSLCLSDFYHGTNENFQLTFSVLANFEKWNRTNFELTSMKYKLNDKRPLSQYLGRWDINPTRLFKTPAKDQHWTAIPSSLFRQSTDQALSYEFTGQNSELSRHKLIHSFLT